MVDIFNIKDIPSCPLDARVSFVHEHAAERARLAAEHIKNQYPRYKMFVEAGDFITHDLFDCMRSDFESGFERIGFFPAIEAEGELSECLNRLLDCSYKSSRDNMRRALEVILVGAYFSHSHVSAEDAKSWLASTQDTPYFSSAVDALSRLPRFERLSTSHDWAGAIKAFHWSLCDTIHTKGEQHSLKELQPVHSSINSISIPEFNEHVLSSALDLYLETIAHIAVILAAYNPILLVGLPLVQKFADNPPLSGFFDEYQSEAFWRLIPAHYHPSLRHIVETDEGVHSYEDWVNDLPDKF